MKTASLFCRLLAFLVLGSTLIRADGKGDGSVSSGSMTCSTEFYYDTMNGAGVILSWACAASLGLGTINDGGTPDDSSDDTFDTPPGTDEGDANNGAITFWTFPNVKVCATGSNNVECCSTLSVNVVKDMTGSNATFTECGLLNQDWINDVKACQSGAGCEATMKWNEEKFWKLESPVISTVPLNDAGPGGAFPLFGAEVVGPQGRRAQLGLAISSLSDWTILPRSVADGIGLVAKGEVDIAGHSTYVGLMANGLNPSGQTVFPVADLQQLSLGVGQPQAGEVLIMPAGGAGFGILGGSFMRHFVYTKDHRSGEEFLGQGLVVSGSPCSLEAGGPAMKGAGSARLGTSEFRAIVENVPAGVPAILLVGTSAAELGGLSLPLDLTPLGFEGCALYQNMHFSFPAVTDLEGASLRIPIPNAEELLGFELPMQWLVLDSPDDATLAGLTRLGEIHIIP